MFTLFSIIRSQLFTQTQDKYLKGLLQAYQQTQEGEFLKELDWRSFQFLWCKDMNTDNGVLGAFNFMFPRKIYLMPDNNREPSSITNFWIQQMFFTVVHQLRHAYQWKSNPLLYLLQCLPVVREFTIQADARAYQTSAEEWMSKRIGKSLE